MFRTFFKIALQTIKRFEFENNEMCSKCWVECYERKFPQNLTDTLSQLFYTYYVV